MKDKFNDLGIAIWSFIVVNLGSILDVTIIILVSFIFLKVDSLFGMLRFICLMGLYNFIELFLMRKQLEKTVFSQNHTNKSNDTTGTNDNK